MLAFSLPEQNLSNLHMNKFNRQQKKVLTKLLQKGSATEYGLRYRFSEIKNYDDYCKHVPIVCYEDIESEIERIKSSRGNVMWPGIIDKFAVSAGTTGKGKHLPLSKERLDSDKRFMRKVIFSYLRRNPDPGLFSGSHLSLPGSIESVIDGNGNVMGEISGFLASLSPSFLKPFQVVSPANLAEMPWKPKFALCLDRALKKDLRVISAVPSWTLVFLQNALEASGKRYVREIWPNLKLIVSGGVSLSSYKSSILKLCEGLSLSFLENYGASEGYFAFTDTREGKDMKLIGNNGLFYEWLPYPVADLKRAVPVQTGEVKKDTEYVLCVTTNAGLWRYVMNDVIRFTELNPPRIQVVGRVHDMSDRYGEALNYWEAERSFRNIATGLDISYERLIIAPRINPSSGKPVHCWFIISSSKITDKEKLKEKVDNEICKLNRHYAIRRETDTLEIPEFLFIQPESFNRWWMSQKKAKAQSKIPNFIYDEQKIGELGKIVS